MEDQSHNIATNQSECASLCRAGCGFFGSPSFQGFCSKCYRDYEDRRTNQSSACLATNLSQDTRSEPMERLEPTSTEKTPTDCIDGPSSSTEGPSITTTDATQPDDLTASSPPTKSPKRNRCFTCRKKVGLTGFECRCGNLYCSLHRYADKHDCSFDYKRMGREEIQKRNPKVVADKIERI